MDMPAWVIIVAVAFFLVASVARHPKVFLAVLAPFLLLAWLIRPKSDRPTRDGEDRR